MIAERAVACETGVPGFDPSHIHVFFKDINNDPIGKNISLYAIEYQLAKPQPAQHRFQPLNCLRLENTRLAKPKHVFKSAWIIVLLTIVIIFFKVL